MSFQSKGQAHGSRLWVRACLVLLLATLSAACSAPVVSRPAGQVSTPPPAGSSTDGTAEAPATDDDQVVTDANRRRLVLATTEEGAALEFVRRLAADFSSAQDWTVEVVPKAAGQLRLDFETAALAGQAPDVLWTTGDQIGPLAATELFDPVGEFFTAADFAPAAVAAANLGGTQWGVPIATGDQLVLLYNRRLLPTPPRTTDDLLNLPRPAGETVLLIANQRDPLWLAAWLGGFGGKVLGDDNRPTLNTPEMVKTLAFLKGLQDTGIVPAEIDIAAGDALFRSEQAAMLVTSAWNVASYTDAQNADVGVAPLPLVSPTNRPATPYLSGVYLLVSRGGNEQRRDAVQAFVTYVSSPDVQARLAAELHRLPALTATLQSAAVQNDPQLNPIADMIAHALPLPGQPGPRRVLSALGPPLSAVLAGEKTPEEAAQEMQATAEAALNEHR